MSVVDPPTDGPPLSGASRLRAHPALTPLMARPGDVCLPHRGGQVLTLSSDAAALLDRLRRPARLDAVLPRLSSEALAAVARLCALGLLVPADDDPTLSPGEHAWGALRPQWQVEAGTIRAPSALVAELGLPPLPTAAEGLIGAGDRIDHDAVCLRLDGLLRQWNPYCGRWYFDAPPVERGGRWLQRQLEAAVDGLFLAAHEVAHARIARVGLLGLLRPDPGHLAALHRASEALAWLVGDVELPIALDGAGYFEGFWPGGAHRSHAHGVATPPVMRALGHRDRAARVGLARRLYLGEGPLRVELPTARAERLAALVVLDTEQTYADYAADLVQPPWNRLYWQHPAIGRWLATFAPPGPVEVDGATIEGVDDLFVHAEAVVLGGALPSGAAGGHDRARMAIQRAALKVAELQRAVASGRLRLDGGALAATGARLEAEWASLAELFERFAAPVGACAEGDTARGEVAAGRIALSADLAAIAGRPVWAFDHPLAGDGMMSTTPHLDPRRWATVDAAAVARALETYTAEAHMALVHGLDGPTLPERCGEAGALRARLIAGDRSAVEAGARWLMAQVDARSLPLPYRLEWAHGAAFVEPSTGFRFS